MPYSFDEIVNRENTACVKYDLREKVFGRRDVLPMWVADMDFKTPDFIIEAIGRRLNHPVLGYSLIRQEYFDSITGWYARRHNLPFEKEWIAFSPGVVPALNLIIMAFTRPGDKIVIQPPVYFPFYSAIENHNRICVTNPLAYRNGKYHMDLIDLEAKIDKDTRMLLLCNPHNPTGNTWDADTLSRLGEICLKRGILVVSDEIHSDLVFMPNRHVPFASISPDLALNSITCSSASKTFNLAGLSTAFLLIADKQKRMQYEKMLNQVHVGAGNLFGFEAAIAAFTEGDAWLDALLSYLQQNVETVQAFFKEHIPAIRPLLPQATYMIWLDCSALGMVQADLRHFMIHSAGLGLNDGMQFGQEGEGFQRINIACPKSVLLEALERLKSATDNYLAKSRTFS